MYLHMGENISGKKLSIESILMILIVVALILMSVVLVRNINMAKKGGAFKQHVPISDFLLKNKRTNSATIADVEYIDTWMTFQYINFIFSLPEDYLRGALYIEDKKYPNLPIERYVKSKNLDGPSFILEIKKFVRDYLSLHAIRN